MIEIKKIKIIMILYLNLIFNNYLLLVYMNNLKIYLI